MGQRLSADVRFIHRAPAHGTCATPNILLTKPNDCQASDCQSAKHAHGPRPLLELGRTAFRPLPMEFASKGTTAFGLVPALYHQTGDAGLPFLLIAIAAIAFSRGRLSARHPTANPQEAATNRVLLMAGIAAVVVYVIGDLLSAVMYDGYSYIDQAISELSAFGSPVRPLPPFVHTHSHDPCSAAGLPHVARTPGRHPSRTWKRAFCWQPLQSGPRARREAAGGNEPVDATIVAGEQLGTLSTVRPSVSQHQFSVQRQRCIGRAPPPADSPTPVASR